MINLKNLETLIREYLRLVLALAVLAVLLVPLASCGGGSTEPPPSSNWDEMIWDLGTWR